MKYSI